MTGNGLRVLVAERKSRKGNASEDARYRRQENKNVRTAEEHGHVVVKRVADTVSSQTLPWNRKNLKAWFTDPAKIAMWDAVLISEVARISRGDSDTWFEIERWCRTSRKYIMDGDGLTWPSADDKEWDNKRRAAREYWESVRDAHAEVRADIRAAGAAIGKPPFGYVTAERPDGYKEFVIDPVAGPLAREAFQRVRDGRTATSVAEWLTEVTGRPWRVKRVTDMIRRRTYLGERDGHAFEPLVSAELWEGANAALSRRSVETGGRRGIHGYSGVIWCECGSPFYHHQATKNGKPVGIPRYRCSRGRRGISGESRCDHPSLGFDAATAAVDAFMRADGSWPWVTVTTGGDAARQAELAKIQGDMQAAMGRKDMTTVTSLAARYAEVDARPAEPIVTKTIRHPDKSVGDLWAEAGLSDQRGMLAEARVTVRAESDGTLSVWDDRRGDETRAAA